MDALPELSRLYDSRLQPVQAEQAGRPVLACVGADVPVEVISAAGYVAVRLAGDPSAAWALSNPASEYCGPGIDPAAVSVLGRIIDGAAVHADGLVASADCEGSVRLFLYLRELQRLDPRPSVPRLTFFDLLHLPQRSAAVYNRRRFDALVAELSQWSGREITDDDLRRTAREHDAVRTLISQICRLRNGPAGPLLTGTEALAVIGASQVSAPAIWTPLATDLVARSGELPPRPGVRVFVTGCTLDHPGVYELIESAGAVVVGEDHDWGCLGGGAWIGEPADIRAALVHRRAARASASAGHSASVRAAQTAQMATECAADLVVAWSRTFDDGPAWDVPVQREAVQAAGISFLAVPPQPYGSWTSATEVLIQDALERVGALSRVDQ